MKTSRRFLLDANVFIEAYRTYYAFEICPGFWMALVKQHDHGRVLSLKNILAELDRGKDPLVAWVHTELPDLCFVPADQIDTKRAFADAQRWVNAQSRYVEAAKAEFAGAADGWLPAYARSRDLVVVTNETRDPLCRKRVKLPDVCDALGVKCVNTFEMLKELGVSFLLDA